MGRVLVVNLRKGMHYRGGMGGSGGRGDHNINYLMIGLSVGGIKPHFFKILKKY